MAECYGPHCDAQIAAGLTFCDDCFGRLPPDLRRRVRIGRTKTKRVERKFAYVISDAIEELLGQGPATASGAD